VQYQNHRLKVGHLVFATAALLALSAALIFKLDVIPPPWFDEGWAMSMARNWVEYGHYGQMRSGIPVSGDMLNIGVPVVAPIALSFKLFGVGFWQGRLPSVLFTICAFIVTYGLARRLYNPRVSVAALAVLVFLSADRWVHPFVIGRLATGEMAAAFFLLLGYLVLALAWERPPYIAGAGLLMGLAAVTKIQALPFTFLALALPAILLLLVGKRRSAGLLLATLGAFALSYVALRSLQQLLQPSHGLQFSTWDLLGTTAVVFSANARTDAAKGIIQNALPAIIAQGLVLARFRIIFQKETREDPRRVVQFSLATFAVSWLAWYLLLSIGWLRYLFVPVFISSPAIADVIQRLSGGFRFRETVRQVANALKWPPKVSHLLAFLFVFLLAWVARQSLGVPRLAYFGLEDSSAQAVADYVNQQTPSDTLVETYEMELFVLLARPYHYPPDQVQLDLNRRTFMKEDIPVTYDPLVDDPDLLILGPMATLWGLYPPSMLDSEFTLVQSIGPYDVYERLRG
jgi:4-amino-4-deoxy-L-arabinose transferase-like glycosyltransferase